jgi:outer membrane biogenesis lipoprotein LolB
VVCPRFFLLALVFFLSACATAPPSTPLPELKGIPRAFEMSARLSVRQGDRNDIARLRWTRKSDSDVWVFSSPIGNEVARIESSARGATLERAGGPREEASSFEALTEQVLGVGLDRKELVAWLHARPSGQGTPADWKVVIDEKQPAGAVEIARRVTATRGDVVVKLVVDDYRVLED